jgi:hypothetical protein
MTIDDKSKAIKYLNYYFILNVRDATNCSPECFALLWGKRAGIAQLP